MGCDGQVTVGTTVMKHNARKLRRLHHDQVLAGFAGRHVVRRLGDTVVVVDHAQVEPILKALRKAGYTPRVSGGPGVSGEER